MTETTTVSKTETESTTETETEPKTETVRRINISDYDPQVVRLTFEQVRDAKTTGNFRSEADYLRLSPVRWSELACLGQETPLWVYEFEGVLRMIRGHTRRRAFMFGHSLLGSADFTTLFAGIDALKLTCTPEQAALLKNDNAHSENMRDGELGKMDYTFASIPMFVDGCNRSEILSQLESKINETSSAYNAKEHGDRLREIDKRVEEIDGILGEIAEKIGNAQAKIDTSDDDEVRGAFQSVIDAQRDRVSDATTERALLSTESQATKLKVRKGVGDKLVQHYVTGELADWVLYHVTTGDKHPEARIDTTGWLYCTKTFLPQFKQAVLKDFGIKTFRDSSQFSGDQRLLVWEGEAFKACQAKFQKLADKRIKGKAKRAADKAAGKPTETKGKRMDSKAIQAWGAGQKSDGAKTLASLFSGKVNLTDPGMESKVETITTRQEVIELIAEHRPAFYRETLMPLVKEIRAELATQAKEAGKAKAEPKTETETEPEAAQQEPKAKIEPKAEPKAKAKRKRGKQAAK